MAELTKTIGTNSRDYATIQAWANDLDDGTNAANDATAYQAGDTAKGVIYDDSDFDEDVNISLGGTIGLIGITLTVLEADRHTGLPNTGARVLMTGNQSFDALSSAVPTIIEWLEIDWNGNGFNGSFGIELNGSATTIHELRNCILHGALDTSNMEVIHISDSARVYNNIIYNCGSTSAITRDAVGIKELSTSTDVFEIYNNSIENIYNTNGDGKCYGIWWNDDNAAKKIRNNICYNIQGTTTGEILDYKMPSTQNNTVITNNADQDSSLPNANGNVRGIADPFTNTATGNFLLANVGECEDAGVDLGTTPTGVEIDILGRDRDDEGDTWDIGAHELVVVGGRVPHTQGHIF